MKISCTCEKCNTIFIGTEEDLFMEFDFSEKKIRFYCKSQSCKHVNVFDFDNWAQKQKTSPLPKTRIM